MARRIERDGALLPERAAGLAGGEPSARFTAARRRSPGTAMAAVQERRLNFHPLLDNLPEEQALTIEVNGRPVTTLICSPTALRELAIGWAFSHGLIDGKAGIGHMSDFSGRVSIMVDDATEIPTYDPMLAASLDTAQCALKNGGLDRVPLADLNVDPAERAGWKMERERFVDVTELLFSRLHSDQAANGSHCAVASDGAEVCIAARDLNRHNAVHKVIGWTVLQEHDRSRAMLCVTGQVDANMVMNVWRAGFPLIASTCGPTSDAIDIADAAGITIVGRVLQAERAVYCHGWRLTIGDDDESPPNADSDN